MGATALESYVNDFETSLSAAVTSSTATTITVASSAGAPTSGNFRVRVNSEIMLVTAGHGTTTWTVLRGQEGSTAAASHASGSLVVHVLTAAGLVNSQLQSQDWTHGGTLHYTGSSVAVSPNAVGATSNYYATYNQYVAQQFTTSGTAIDRVALYLKAATATTSADVTVSLQTNGTNGPSGTLVAGTVAITVPGEFVTTTPRWVSIPLRATVAAATTYWIVLSRQTTDATNYLQVAYTSASSPVAALGTTGANGSYTLQTTKLLFDVYAGTSGKVINTTEDDALSPSNPALTTASNWTELAYNNSGYVTSIYEYLGSFRNTRTLTYDSANRLITVA